MVGEQFRALFQFYVNPRRAASLVLDHGSFLFAVIAAAVVALAISMAANAVEAVEFGARMQAMGVAPVTDQVTLEQFQNMQRAAAAELRGRYFATGLQVLLVLAVAFVPFCILVLTVWEHLGGGMTILFRDYLPVLAGLLFAWTAAHLPLVFIWWSPAARAGLVVPLQVAGLAVFVALAAPVLATVMGATMWRAAATAVAGVVVSAITSRFFAHSTNLLYMLASPWLLFYGYRMFGGELMALGGGLSERQQFKRQLELATTNPHDADAHYQLGLLYAQRRLPVEAEERFRKALAIDPNEPETLFQLGKLLRQQEGRGEEARQMLEKGATLDPKLSSHEVWRELGAVALNGGQVEEALRYLDHYVKAREYDPEGLVLQGRALEGAGRKTDAKAAYEQAIECVKGAPRFRRAELSRWESQARQALREL